VASFLLGRATRENILKNVNKEPHPPEAKSKEKLKDIIKMTGGSKKKQDFRKECLMERPPYDDQRSFKRSRPGN